MTFFRGFAVLWRRRFKARLPYRCELSGYSGVLARGIFVFRKGRGGVKIKQEKLAPTLRRDSPDHYAFREKLERPPRGGS